MGAGATRCGSTSPAVSEDELREGIRRIGRVIEEQVELYGALTGVKASRICPQAKPRTTGGMTHSEIRRRPYLIPRRRIRLWSHLERPRAREGGGP